jgi:hypothetical protein
MQPLFDSGLIWWITAVDLPAMSGLFWMIHRIRTESEDAIDTLHETLEVRTAQLREALLAFKLEVAKSYATACDMKDLETRIVAHLLRIEAKLDKTALTAAELKATKTE